MCVKSSLAAAVWLALTIGAPGRIAAQETPASPPPQTTPSAAQPASGMGHHRVGGFVPGQKRGPGDPAQIARGKMLFDINCRGCHGADLRGGDLGGPNLLRSQVALADLNGELIVPIIEGSRKNMGMPAIGISHADALAVAAYVRSVVETIGRQGKPPSAGRPAPSVLVGNASEGQTYFAVKCATCHSATGDLQGIATRIPDPRVLQTTWVAGGGRRWGGEPDPRRTVTATVTLPSGENVEGELVRIDDFLVTLKLPDGTDHTFQRNGDIPKVVVRDPMKTHRDLLGEYTDKDIHDVTAYLVTLK